MNFVCPCGSLIPYESCCKKYHDGRAKASKALDLLRSRYSAYVLDKAEYIIETTHRNCSEYDEDKDEWLDTIQFFSENTEFQKLEVVKVEERKNEAFITFVVHMWQKGKDCSFQEKSHFIKEKGFWTYLSGQIIK